MPARSKSVINSEPGLRHVKVFLTVADTGSVSAAAKLLLRAQSAVTRSIMEIEAVVGAPLFERRSTGMGLTVFGEAYLRRARRAATEFESARREVADASGRSMPASSPVFSMRIGSRRLAAVVALTESHHMPDVARQLGITQPAVSAAVREIEDVLGIRLFDRTPRGLFPTPAAIALARRAKLASAELRHAIEEIAALQGVTRGQVNIGALPFGRTAILPRAVTRLLRTHPAIHVAVVEGPFETLAVSLRSGELDFIFGALRDFPPGSDITGESLLSDRLSVIVRAGHALTRKRRITLRDLAGSDWILNREGTPSRARLEAAFHASGLPTPNNRVETSSLAMTRGLLLESDCLTALSRHQIEHELRFGMLALLPIELPETSRQIGLMRRTNASPSPASEALAREIIQAVQDLDPEDPPMPDIDPGSAGATVSGQALREISLQSPPAGRPPNRRRQG